MTVFRLRLQVILPKIVSLSSARLENVRQCLLAYFAHTGADACRYSQASPDALYGTAELSRSVFSRARQDALAAGLIRTERVRVKRGHKRPPDRVWIEHARIIDLAQASRDQVGSGGTSREQVGSGGITIRKPPNPQSPNLSIPPSSSALKDPPAAGVGGDFDFIAGELRKLGLGLAEETASQFLASGGTVEDFEAIADHFRSNQLPAPPAWSPGALRVKLVRWHPGSLPKENWPTPNRDHERAKQSEERQRVDRRNAERRIESTSRKKLLEAERVVNERIEQVVKRMTQHERSEVLDRRCPGWKSFGLHSASNIFLSYFREEIESLQEAHQ